MENTVEYFGINIDSTETPNVIRKNDYSNLRSDFVNGMTVELKQMKQEYWPYISCPMLFLRFDLLNFYTQKMEDESLITNCNTLKALARSNKRPFVMFTTEKIINNISKFFYVLHAEDYSKFVPDQKFKDNMHIGKRLEATLKENFDGYFTFGCFCKSVMVGNSSIKVYYTHQIDLFDNDMNPIEVKARYLREKTENKQKQSEREKEDNISTVLQCKIGGVNKLIFGIHDGIEAEMIQMDLKELDIDNVAKEVKIRLGTMKKNLSDIIQRYLTYKNRKERAFRIRYENQWTFEEINREDLLKSYAQFQ
uniref:Decapping nuclease n=1 Tax=Panagrolaimus sp. PS1159 TaxID=55785 RepID=A0AC35FDC3_9BILA